LPIAEAGKLPEVHVTAVTGSTGAGQRPTATSHFSWRNNNMSVYKAFDHQHLTEIGESVAQLQAGFDAPINFVPVRGDFPRGIMASIYVESDLTEEEANKAFTNFYANDPFTHVMDQNPHLKQVVNTNKCVLYVKKYGSKLHIISMIDNLTKGASGQAVQNLNLIFGLDERAGLGLKPVAF
jgi:N-acetyl-gamma-glutamyl-phosphate reductase